MRSFSFAASAAVALAAMPIADHAQHADHADHSAHGAQTEVTGALKRILKLDRLRLRGPNGAKDEFHLAAAAQNLRKMAKMRPMQGLAMA